MLAELARIRTAGEAVRALGMRFNAGHALNYQNVQAIAGLAQCYLTSGDNERAEQTIALVPPDKTSNAAVARVRAALELEARRFAEHLGYIIDWSAVSRLDDMTFVNSVAQVAPFDVAAKQALLETRSLIARAELAMQLMQFFGHAQTDRPATLQ